MAPKVLLFSLPRTGTQSTCDALEFLGYDPIYHMREVAKNGHPGTWAELLDQKFGSEGKTPVDKTKLADMLQKFDGIADFPASIFVEELVELYPLAKFILIDRDEDAWCMSMEGTVGKVTRTSDPTSPMHPMRVAYSNYCWKDDFPTYGRQFARDWRQRVLKAVKGHHLLEYNVNEGWKPLCDYLGKCVPDAPFPARDDKHADQRARAAGAP